MTTAATTSLYRDFASWLKAFYRDRGLDFTQCGFKLGPSLGAEHQIDLETGNWERPNYSANKPPRWLFHLEIGSDGTLLAHPVSGGAANVGQANTAQGRNAGLVLRLLPLIQVAPDRYLRHDSFEAHVLFIFHGPVPRGSSSETFAFNPTDGTMSYRGEPLPYLAAALLGIQPADSVLELPSDSEAAARRPSITYGEALEALSTGIRVKPLGQATQTIPLFDLTSPQGLDALKSEVTERWEAAPPPASARDVAAAEQDETAAIEAAVVPASPLTVPADPDLLGIDPAVYRQINAALLSGKRHIMLYGPPGTGKTSLARWIATHLTVGGEHTLITGSADWGSQDIIGGYQPTGGGSIAFVPGVLLQNFDRPLIIDELNRCDIDKVIGPLFTVLSGQETTLPYRVDIEDPTSQQYAILPLSKAGADAHEFAPGPAWRLLATINSIDKASLYQMSYALSRRFAWVYVDAPGDTAGFIRSFLHRLDPSWPSPPDDAPCPLAQFWTAINQVRVIGPAPIMDAIRAVRSIEADATFFGMPAADLRAALLDAIDMVLLPMLDGIVLQDAEHLTVAAVEAFGLEGSERQRITARMRSVAV